VNYQEFRSLTKMASFKYCL